MTHEFHGVNACWRPKDIAAGAVYAELPEPESYGTRNGRMDPKQPLFTEDDMQDHADRTHALRASHGQAPAQPAFTKDEQAAWREGAAARITPSPQAAESVQQVSS